MLFEILSLIISAVAGVLAGFLLLRFWMQALRVRPPMSFAHSIFQLTDWIVKPIRRIVPGFLGFDWASVVAAWLVAVLASVFLLLLANQFAWPWVFLLAFHKLVQWAIFGLMGLLILEVIFSFVNPHAPLAPLVSALNAPFLAPIRRIIPAIGGFDFSVLVAFIILQVLERGLARLLAYLSIILM
ncbi:YggT family protein [Undibacterium cyanobacteriorum]|uniref:YggT family protein n=1 Tax=Undibacterium cyanobacteriorum TaxID=3073561 RepID=A0ABY9RF82_9BURK|nr:YggT family protein [Undibacterium sp. 20NA77.5]WMW79877.1 YggT family protein [Undibacterium sp. 20NA77.5]